MRTRARRQETRQWSMSGWSACIVRYPWCRYIFCSPKVFFRPDTPTYLFFDSCSRRVQSISHTITSSHQHTHTYVYIYMCIYIYIYWVCITTTRMRHLSSSYSESEWMALLLTIWQATCAWDRRRERENRKN